MRVWIRFLDNTEKQFEIQKKGALAVELINNVFRELNLGNPYCFGLRFVLMGTTDKWLNGAVSFEKQWQKFAKKFNLTEEHLILEFQVKFFVPEPNVLQAIDQYQYYLQIKRDIYTLKLPMPEHHMCELLSNIVQLELGDYDPNATITSYATLLKLPTTLTWVHEQTIGNLHKQLRGLPRSDTVLKFLNLARWFDMYGIFTFKGKDANGQALRMGVSLTNLFVLNNNVRVNTFHWAKMKKISVLRHMFYICPRLEKGEPETLFGFNMETKANAKMFWRTFIEHYIFSSSSLLSKMNSANSNQKDLRQTVGAISMPEPVGSDTNAMKSHKIITVQLFANNQGQYGFSFSKKFDLSEPTLITNIKRGSTTALVKPSIQINDEILEVNGQRVDILTHDEIVAIIFSSIESITLTLRTTRDTDENEADPIYGYVPKLNESTGDALSKSIAYLTEELNSGSLMAQYCQLPKVNFEFESTEAVKPENVKKNRYSDIIPYDKTRVVLANNKSGDYINASHINLKIPTGQLNRYIAAQGPIKKTVTDFWHMVQQTKCNSIVMLTNLIESGKTKCHQYWPDTNSNWLKLDNGLELHCLQEQFHTTGCFVMRDFLLRDSATGEERTVRHMHYLVWPDHDVPSDVQQCLEFLQTVRSVRSEAASVPMVVHCSAGIGRTGVFIMLDLALDLLEAKVSINPLNLLKKVRNMRPKMIQTAEQFRFVCEGIFAMYSKM